MAARAHPHPPPLPPPRDLDPGLGHDQVPRSTRPCLHFLVHRYRVSTDLENVFVDREFYIYRRVVWYCICYFFVCFLTLLMLSRGVLHFVATFWCQYQFSFGSKHEILFTLSVSSTLKRYAFCDSDSGEGKWKYLFRACCKSTHLAERRYLVDSLSLLDRSIGEANVLERRFKSAL